MLNELGELPELDDQEKDEERGEEQEGVYPAHTNTIRDSSQMQERF